MDVTFHDLNGSYECFHRRKYNFETKTAASPVKAGAVLQKRVILEALAGKIDINDIDDAIRLGMDQIDFKSNQERIEKCKDYTKRCKRFVRSVNARQHNTTNPWAVLSMVPDLDITVSTKKGDVEVSKVHPDVIITHGNSMAGYIIRTGKPSKAGGASYKVEDARQDKKLYVMLKYMEELAENMFSPGHTVGLTVGYAFLRKPTDKDPGKATEHFDDDFFMDENMNTSSNVIVIGENYTTGVFRQSQYDTDFEPLFETFVDGMMPDECSEEQCADCMLNESCHYVHAPVALEDVEKAVDASLIELSGVQERIEMFRQGYAVVNAVPGAGKTLVLVLRIITLLMNGVKPEEIAIITFTNSGAEVFKNRIKLYNEDIGTGEDISAMTATTFNGLGQMILEQEYMNLGFQKPPRVIDPIERSGIIAEILNEHTVPDLDYRNFTVDMPNCKGPLAVASAAFNAIKQKGYTVFDAEAIRKAAGYRFCSRAAAEELAKLYDEYDAKLRENSLIEYADQEVMLLAMLEQNPYYFDKFGWKHILVDECQDTSENQFKLLKYMTNTPSFESLMVVGDDSQAIYGFRDTSPKFFMDFAGTMGLQEQDVTQFYMTDNFRSTPEIIDFANQIIQKNIWKVAKDIVPTKANGNPVTVKCFLDTKDEYEYIVKTIQSLLDDGIEPEKIAFIASTRTELLKMADLLTMNDIPSVMLNPERMLENSRVLAGIALCNFFQNPEDTKDVLTALNAMMGGDLFMLPKEQIDILIQMQKDKAAELKALPEDEFRKGFFELMASIDEDDEIFESFIASLENQPTMAQVFQYSNNFKLYGEKAEKRREHNYPGIVLTTAHSSKGMEWPVVINSVSRYDKKELANNRDAEEEQRRLLFVSATRAREQLFITGTYVAYGSSKDRHYNMFLKEACDIVGNPFDAAHISALYAEKARIQKARREAEKKKMLEESAKKLNEKAKELAG